MTEKPLAEKRPTGINKVPIVAESARSMSGEPFNDLRIDLDQLLDNPDQPRKYIDPNYIAELAATIRLHGLLFKPAARLVEGKYQLIAGHCRRDAVKQIRDEATDPAERLKWATIPVTLVEMTDEQSAIAALIENIQREDLSAAEEGEAYARLQERYGFATARALAERLGVEEQRVTRRIRIHYGPQALRDALTRGVKIAPLQEDGTPARRHEVRKLFFEAANELLRLHLYFQKKYPGVEGGKANPRSCADLKLDPIIERALAQGWSTQKIRAFVDRAVAGRGKDDEAEAEDQQKEAIVERRGDRLVVHLKRLGRADESAQAAALETLKTAFAAARKASQGPSATKTV